MTCRKKKKTFGKGTEDGKRMEINGEVKCTAREERANKINFDLFLIITHTN